MIRRLLVGLCCLSVLGAAGAGAAWQGLLARIETPHRDLPSEGVFVDVRPGDSTRAIAERLEAAGVVREAWTFRFAAWRGRHERSLQAGEYHFDAPVSPAAALAKIVAGRVHLKAITFPEGLTLPQMGAIVEEWGLAPAAEFAAAAQRVELVADLDPDAADLEGYLFPETYSLPRTATVDDLVAAMVARFRVVFDAELRSRAAERGLSVRDVVTLASIIQRESGSGEEFALVSAVFNNRLRIGMPLQSDPTTIYALERAGRYDGNLTRANLRFDSPYNTYVYGGLPPGPIAAPGGAVLRAALAPADVTYLYFVSRNDGTHAFADTLREHNRNVREFQVEYFRRRRGP
ncbi:MAG: endolytic transglycosylase MltG [Acidobacteria bacterium]|nr:endolytic transglycosylase MltG [Acidobacteriota bacterium]